MIDPDGILTMEYVRKRLASRDVETPEAMALRSLIILRLKIDTMTASAATLRDDIDVAMIAFGRGDVTTAEHRALSSCIDAASSIERAKSSSINAGAEIPPPWEVFGAGEGMWVQSEPTGIVVGYLLCDGLPMTGDRKPSPRLPLGWRRAKSVRFWWRVDGPEEEWTPAGNDLHDAATHAQQHIADIRRRFDDEAPPMRCAVCELAGWADIETRA